MKKIFVTAFAVSFASILLVVGAPGQLNQQVRRRDVQAQLSSQFIAKFVDNLDARLKGKSVGYAFYVTSGSGLAQGRAAGDARRAPDSNPRKMTLDDKFNIASASKTITAAAVLKILNDKQIDLDTPVYTYLPSDWTLGNNIKSITFRQLLTHTSAIRCAGNVSYAELKQCIAVGVVVTNKTQKYNNSNFGLFRIIIPRLVGAPMITIPGKPKPDDSKYSAFYANQYIAYVQKNIFAPAGLSGIECKPIATDPALTYQFPTPLIAGTSFGDTTETSGSQGWNMNVKQLAGFLNVLFYTEKILPAAVTTKMKEQQLGLFADSTTLTGITSYEHTGFYPGKDADGKVRNPGELNSAIVSFSNGLNVALIVNSQLGPGLRLPAEIKAAMKDTLK
jgi:CubicO group peptidase (beta-lactamase class C family)